MLKFSEWLVENKKEPTVNGSENLCESPKRSKDPKPKQEKPEKETKPKTKKVKVSDWYFDDDGNYVPVVWKEVPITDDSDKKDTSKKLSKEEVYENESKESCKKLLSEETKEDNMKLLKNKGITGEKLDNLLKNMESGKLSHNHEIDKENGIWDFHITSDGIPTGTSNKIVIYNKNSGKMIDMGNHDVYKKYNKNKQ